MTLPARENDPIRSDGVPSQHGSRSANQSKAEEFPASPSQGEQETPGETHPQAPNTDVPGSAADVPVGGTGAAPGTSETLPRAQPVHVPVLDETGDAER